MKQPRPISFRFLHSLFPLLLFLCFSAHGASSPFANSPLNRVHSSHYDCLSSPALQHPSWSDIGMEDILASAISSLPQPSSASRGPNRAPQMAVRSDTNPQKTFRSPENAAAAPHRPLLGHIYQLLCLRL